MNGQVECKQGDDQVDKKCRDGKLCVIQVTRAEVVGCPHKYRIPIGCIWNTPIKTHRVVTLRNRFLAFHAAAARRGFFHATPRCRRVHYKSIRANKAFSRSVSRGVNTRGKPWMCRETFRGCWRPYPRSPLWTRRRECDDYVIRQTFNNVDIRSTLLEQTYAVT